MKWNKCVGISETGYRRVLEEILNRNLSESQIRHIINDWKAFAEDPVKYADTVVVKMVQLDLDQP